MRLRGLAEIEFLIKESEVLTGQAGRVFVISGADKLSYRVRWHPMVIEVERLDSTGAVIDTQHLPPHDFATHSVVEALTAGQLYTAPVQTRH
ncbi:hypothetical protein C667_00380 [Thauera phenylacetica B4P]|uniref:Uncharacterized protein n=2 Tax=Thauera phenylacetica TaxID=164400 RepID=N6Z5B2_9RHOO|nr:hypothetical protein C667_00380 [Thauera phenylacetica B4P]